MTDIHQHLHPVCRLQRPSKENPIRSRPKHSTQVCIVDTSCLEGRRRLTKRAGYREVPTNEQRKFFKVGRVFMMLWTEPAGPRVEAGGGTLPNGSHISATWLDGKAYSEIRRFVVLQEGYGNSICS